MAKAAAKAKRAKRKSAKTKGTGSAAGAAGRGGGKAKKKGQKAGSAAVGRGGGKAKKKGQKAGSAAVGGGGGKAKKKGQKASAGGGNKGVKKSEKTAPAVGPLMVSGRELIAILELTEGRTVTLRTVQNWAKDHGMPFVSRDRYDVGRVLKWWVERDRESRAPTGNAEKRLAEAQALLAEQRGRKLAVEADLAEGKVIDREKLEAGWLERVTAVRRGLTFMWMPLASELTRLAGGAVEQKQVREVVGEQINKLLETFVGSDAIEDGKVLPITVGEAQG